MNPRDCFEFLYNFHLIFGHYNFIGRPKSKYYSYNSRECLHCNPHILQLIWQSLSSPFPAIFLGYGFFQNLSRIQPYKVRDFPSVMLLQYQKIYCSLFSTACFKTLLDGLHCKTIQSLKYFQIHLLLSVYGISPILPNECTVFPRASGRFRTVHGSGFYYVFLQNMSTVDKKV